MRKFYGHADIIFTKIYTPSEKYSSLPFCLESVSRFRVNSKYSVERSDLNCYIVLYTISGEGVLQFKGDEYRIRKDQVMFIDCAEYHLYKSANNKEWEFYFMLIYGCGVKIYYEILFSERYYILDYFDLNIIEKFIDAILYLDENPSQQFELLAGRHINDLLIQLFLVNNNSIVSTNFTRVIDYIKENYNRKISIDELAKIANVSKYHFIRKFKKIYFKTPYEYITSYKINQAKALLSVTDHSVDEISDRVGFNDSTTFIRAFKNFVGVSPNKYRDSAVNLTDKQINS